MNNRALTAFLILLKRELWENKNLFIAAPVVLTILFIVAIFWVLPQLPEGALAESVGQLGAMTEGVGPTVLAPLLMPVATPFMITLYICTLIYLIK